MNRLREAFKLRPDHPCSILLDTKGPEIRTGLLETDKINLVKGQELEITTDYTYVGNNQKIACSYQDLVNSVEVQGTI